MNEYALAGSNKKIVEEANRRKRRQQGTRR
jgi:hypothetical protein